ncbi:conserved hypothetical protein (plasmid) [Borreliella burgdorferi CA-11.2A]|nr:conserved hypothetical protein [Borreliella burgdorferi 72a]ACN56203.1 conserved hypothetical protein [Borreliella burgdorferi CA-11.2A]
MHVVILIFESVFKCLFSYVIFLKNFHTTNFFVSSFLLILLHLMGILFFSSSRL